MCRMDFICTFCYGIMAQAIRSEVDKQLIMYCSRIILNLARYNSTTANTFQEGGLVTIAQMLLRWCDKDCEIFNTLCTLIWIFAHCPVKCKVCNHLGVFRQMMVIPLGLSSYSSALFFNFFCDANALVFVSFCRLYVIS